MLSSTLSRSEPAREKGPRGADTGLLLGVRSLNDVVRKEKMKQTFYRKGGLMPTRAVKLHYPDLKPK